MLPKGLLWPMAQTAWAKQLDPLISNPIVNGQLLDINLTTGNNSIDHKLGRQPKGWFIVSPGAAGQVYQSPSQPNPTLILTLTSTANIPCSIWVF